jgi:hypothetical protein
LRRRLRKIYTTSHLFVSDGTADVVAVIYVNIVS